MNQTRFVPLRTVTLSFGTARLIEMARPMYLLVLGADVKPGLHRLNLPYRAEKNGTSTKILPVPCPNRYSGKQGFKAVAIWSTVSVDFTEEGKPENSEKNPRSTEEANYHNSTVHSHEFWVWESTHDYTHAGGHLYSCNAVRPGLTYVICTLHPFLTQQKSL